MPDPQQILADPNFHELPLGERLKVMRTVDPNFAALPPKEQGTVLYQSAVKFHPIAADTVPKDAGFWSTIGSDIAALPGGIYNAARHPLDTLANATDARLALRPKAAQAMKEGHPIQAAGYGLASMMPFVGPAAAQAGEELGGGQPGQGAAHAVEALAPSAIKGVSEIPQVRAGVRAVGKVVKSRVTGRPIEGAPQTPSLPGPYFNERSTIDPQMHGPVPSDAEFISPASANEGGGPFPPRKIPTGTVNVPPTPPTPQPTGMTQNARGPLVSPVATKPPSQVFVGSSGTIPGKITTEAPAAPAAPSTKLLDDIAKGMAGKKFSALSPEQQKAASTLADRIGAATPQSEAVVKPSTPSPNGTLKPPVTATTPESYTKKALDEIMKKAAEGDPEGNQTGAYTGDRGEHKALNVARYLNKQGISADAYQTILDTAKKTGDWSPVDRINAEAYKTGKAGEYAGFLPKRSYDPVVPAVGSGEITPRATFKGKSTPQLIIDHLKELDKLRK